MADMSFLPEDYLEKRAQRRTNLLSIGLFFIVMAAVACAFYVTDRQRQEVRQQQREVDQQFIEAAKRLEQLDQLQQQKQAMIRKARVTGLLLEKVPRSLLLAELTNNMPPSVSLLELDLQSKVAQRTRTRAATALDKARQDKAAAKSPEPELPQTDVTVNLVGVAPTDVDVARFMTSLNRCQLFYDVTLVFSEQSQIRDQTLRRFRVELKVNQNVDVTGFTPTVADRSSIKDPMSDRLSIDPRDLAPIRDEHARPASPDTPPQTLKD